MSKHWWFLMRIIQQVHILTFRFIILQSAQSPTCFGHLLWPSSGRYSLKEYGIEHSLYKYKMLSFRKKFKIYVRIQNIDKIICVALHVHMLYKVTSYLPWMCDHLCSSNPQVPCLCQNKIFCWITCHSFISFIHDWCSRWRQLHKFRFLGYYSEYIELVCCIASRHVRMMIAQTMHHQQHPSFHFASFYPFHFPTYTVITILHCKSAINFTSFSYLWP